MPEQLTIYPAQQIRNAAQIARERRHNARRLAKAKQAGAFDRALAELLAAIDQHLDDATAVSESFNGAKMDSRATS
jgi:hypothetical protein